MIEVKIDTEYITLGQFLKITDLISSGGEAKMFLASVRVTVNGHAEDRRGRKLVPRDVVRVNQQNYEIQQG